MSGYNKFQKLILDTAQEIILSNFDPSNEELQEVYMNHLLGTSGPNSIKRNWSRDEKYFGKIFYYYIEIFESFEVLKNITIFINSFPYTRKQIKRSTFLHYHISNYFNEVYILKERLLSFLKIFGRSFKNDDRHTFIKKNTRPLFKLVRESLLKITSVRSYHVHQFRFFDEDISRLKSIEILLESKDERILNFYSQFLIIVYKQTRKKWKDILEQNNKYINVLLDIYFEKLINIMFDENYKLIYPKAQKP